MPIGRSTPRSASRSTPLVLSSSGQEWQFHIATDILWSRMPIGRSTPRSASRSTPWYCHLVVKNGNFTLLLTSIGQEWQLAELPLDLPADLLHGTVI